MYAVLVLLGKHNQRLSEYYIFFFFSTKPCALRRLLIFFYASYTFATFFPAYLPYRICGSISTFLSAYDEDFRGHGLGMLAVVLQMEHFVLFLFSIPQTVLYSTRNDRFPAREVQHFILYLMRTCAVSPVLTCGFAVFLGIYSLMKMVLNGYFHIFG